MSTNSLRIDKYAEMLCTATKCMPGIKYCKDEDKAKMKIEPQIHMIQQQECHNFAHGK